MDFLPENNNNTISMLNVMSFMYIKASIRKTFVFCLDQEWNNGK